MAAVAYLLALVAWLALLVRWVPMLGHGTMDPTAPGGLEAMGTANGVGGVVRYLVMWGVMMVAMMYPSSAGVFQWYADRHERLQPAGAAGGLAAFVGVYTLEWVLVGLVPLGVNVLVPIASLAATWGSLHVGVALLAVAAFQFSALKRSYLGRCRTPSGFLVSRYRPGLPGAVRLGAAFGRRTSAPVGP